MNKKDMPLYFSLIVFGLVFPPLYLIYLMWVLQKRFPKLHKLYFCFIVAVFFLTIEIFAGSWANISFQVEFIDQIFMWINYPGNFLTNIFLEPMMDSLQCMLLSYIMSILFYTLLIYVIAVTISLIKNRISVKSA